MLRHAGVEPSGSAPAWCPRTSGSGRCSAAAAAPRRSSRTPSSGQAALMRPMSAAFSAGTRSPRSIAISAARVKPTRAETNSEAPPSGTRPMFTNASRKYADSLRHNQVRRQGEGQARADRRAVHRADERLGHLADRRDDRVVPPGQGPGGVQRRRPPAMAFPMPSFRSAPEQNACRPRSAAPRAPRRRPRGRAARSSRSRDSALDQAFIRSGRFSTILAAAPVRYNRTCLIAACWFFPHVPQCIALGDGREAAEEGVRRTSFTGCRRSW